MGQYWFIVICGENLLGRVDLRVDRGRFKNHMIFWEAPVPTADDTEGRPSHEQQATRPPRASINAFGTDRG